MISVEYVKKCLSVQCFDIVLPIKAANRRRKKVVNAGRQADRQTDRPRERETDRPRERESSINSIPRFWEKCEKCEKIKKDLKNHSSKTIDRTEFCLASSERGELALS